jgi:hypothetical protein
VIEGIVERRRRGFPFIALAGDNFYPRSLTDIQLAERQNNPARVATMKGIRAERSELMGRLAELPKGMVLLPRLRWKPPKVLIFWKRCARHESWVR